MTAFGVLHKNYQRCSLKRSTWPKRFEIYVDASTGGLFPKCHWTMTVVSHAVYPSRDLRVPGETRPSRRSPYRRRPPMIRNRGRRRSHVGEQSVVPDPPRGRLPDSWGNIQALGDLRCKKNICMSNGKETEGDHCINSFHVRWL